MPDFVDSQWEALPFLRSEWGLCVGKVWWGAGGEEEGRTGLGR